MALDIWIQFLQQGARVLCSIAAQMFLLKKEVDAEVRLADYRRVLDGEVANAR
jgi:hypothetical protein